MSGIHEAMMERLKARVAKAKITEDAREELEFQIESFDQRFGGQMLEGETLEAALANILDIFSLAYRLALAEAREIASGE